MTVDEATIHAAIMAVNEALEKENSTETFNALNNPSTCLKQLEVSNADRYQTLLLHAKREKTTRNQDGTQEDEEAAKEKDVYDSMLTQSEIQEGVADVNTAVKREEAEAKSKYS